jgi:uncharacterized protein with LGFP repeats
VARLPRSNSCSLSRSRGECLSCRATCPLLSRGCPASATNDSPDGTGRFNHFTGGSIYWTPATGAHEVHGAIRDKWAALGWERGVAGYPLTDETTTPDGAGRFNHFTGGSIYWTPATGAHEVYGAMMPTETFWSSAAR